MLRYLVLLLAVVLVTYSNICTDDTGRWSFGIADCVTDFADGGVPLNRSFYCFEGCLNTQTVVQNYKVNYCFKTRNWFPIRSNWLEATQSWSRESATELSSWSNTWAVRSPMTQMRSSAKTPRWEPTSMPRSRRSLILAARFWFEIIKSSNDFNAVGSQHSAYLGQPAWMVH